MRNRNLHSQRGQGSVSFTRFVMWEYNAASGHDVFQANIIGSWQAWDVSPVRESLYRFLAACLLLPSCFCNSSFAQKKTVYNMFLEEAVPANGSEVVFNASVLRWPFQKGVWTNCDVKLLQNNLFENNMTLPDERLSGAMYNPHQALAGGTWYWRYRVTGKSWSAVYHFKVTDKALYMVSQISQKFFSSIPYDMIRELYNYMKQTGDRLSLGADLRTRFLKNYKNGIQKSDKLQ